MKWLSCRRTDEVASNYFSVFLLFIISASVCSSQSGKELHSNTGNEGSLGPLRSRILPSTLSLAGGAETIPSAPNCIIMPTCATLINLDTSRFVFLEGSARH